MAAAGCGDLGRLELTLFARFNGVFAYIFATTIIFVNVYFFKSVLFGKQLYHLRCNLNS